MATATLALLSLPANTLSPFLEHRSVNMKAEEERDAGEALSREQEEEKKNDEAYMVFEGSQQEDVTYAKVFWRSLCLQPPIESNLVSVDIKQRLKIAKTPQSGSHVPKQHLCSIETDEILQKAYQLQLQDEKRRYLEMAKKRDEIMALFKKQREDRIKKEMLSRLHKPNIRSELTQRDSCRTLDQDIKEVQELV